jgi:prevent-host-death family protein
MMKLVPVTEVKRRATEVIADLKKFHSAVMITDHGREAAVMVDVKTWNGLQRRLQILDLVSKGVADLRAGRVISQEEAKARLAKFAL